MSEWLLKLDEKIKVCNQHREKCGVKGLCRKACWECEPLFEAQHRKTVEQLEKDGMLVHDHAYIYDDSPQGWEFKHFDDCRACALLKGEK